MKKIISISLCIAAISLCSCKKEKKAPEEEAPVEATTPTTYPNYSNLKVGNYWIYERFVVDPSGNATSINIIDSCYVEKDTTINGNVYHKYMSPSIGYPNLNPTIQYPSYPQYLRDSLSYLVNASGWILFSSENFTTEFKTSVYVQPPTDTVWVYTNKMGDKDLSFTTPLGTFTTSSMQDIYKMYPNYNSCTNNIRIIDTRYAENIGKISQGFQFFAGICNHHEARLIRYHLD